MYKISDNEVEAIMNHFFRQLKYDIEEYYGVAAEGFCHALHHYNESMGSAFKTYAFRIMEKCCQRYTRDLHREKRKTNMLSFSYILDEEGEEKDALEYVQDVADKYEEVETMDSIISDLKQVMNPFELEMTLLFMEGYTDEQVAKQMNCSLKDIKNTKNNTYSRANVMLMADRYRKAV